MKIFMVTRGSQGDVYPYLTAAETLMKRGHEITLSMPRAFESQAKNFGIPYVLQNYDDINALLETSKNNRDLLVWMRRVTDQQFEEFIPILEKHDLFVVTNTEFSAPHIAEYCNKPIIRTAYGPFVPGRKIPPPVMPWPRAHPVIRPFLLWNMLNLGINFLTVGIINKNRKRLGMPPFRDQGHYAPAMSDNFLMYSPSLGDTDPDWQYRWHIGGYCFNDELPYEKDVYQRLQDFVKKDARPVLFFTMGSCKTKKMEEIYRWILNTCRRHGYKLVLGCSWWHKGTELNGEDCFPLDTVIPHKLIFPFFDGIIHHGGSGTTHSAARAGIPQMMLPIFIDQHYWGNRIYELGLGPHYLPATKASEEVLEARIVDLMGSENYKQNAEDLGRRIRAEDGVASLCTHIESYMMPKAV